MLERQAGTKYRLPTHPSSVRFYFDQIFSLGLQTGLQLSQLRSKSVTTTLASLASRDSSSQGPDLREVFGLIDHHKMQVLHLLANFIFSQLLFLSSPLCNEAFASSRTMEQGKFRGFTTRIPQSVLIPLPLQQLYTSRTSRSNFLVFYQLVKEHSLREVRLILLEWGLKSIHVYFFVSHHSFEEMTVSGGQNVVLKDPWSSKEQMIRRMDIDNMKASSYSDWPHYLGLKILFSISHHEQRQ